jgi:uncharacterized protein (DUF1684 family)
MDDMEIQTNELENFRKMKDEFFAHDQHSPLTRSQKSIFKGLSYFPESPELRFELELEVFADWQEIQLQTSTGDLQVYRRHGQIRFEVKSQPARLTIFSNENGLFLPFADSLAGTQTYPAGRYLEPELLPDGRLLVDFNLAYNPYCAYNERWSCPLTPFENRLKVPIHAGEKLPDQDWAEHT